jgi:phosphohistidine phosphatase SixA
MMKRLALALWLLICAAAPAAAQSTIFVVRHAERADAGAAKPETDPDLSGIGHARAAALAAMLEDAGITAIFVTDRKRTQQTAAPLAKARKLTPVVVPANDTAGLLERLRTQKGAALVVGHSNTVPEIVKGLGIDQAVTIGDDEFDRLFVVIRAAAGPAGTGTPTLVALRFR